MKMKTINNVINVYVHVYRYSYNNVYRKKNVYVISYLLIQAITNTKSIVTISLVVMYKGLLIRFITTEYKLPKFLF
jgi:hypothetical protein